MPLVIVLVAFGILMWSQWSTRRDRAEAARQLETMVGHICSGETIEGIRWADSIIRDSVVDSVEKVCSSPVDVWSAAVMDAASEDGLIEVRINADSTTVMTLEIERLESGELLVRGWSSE